MESKMNDYIIEARRVISEEIDALTTLMDEIGDGFIQTIDTIKDTKGKVVITGVGKSGHIARKMAATFSSLGTPSFFLHPDDAMHGDLGMITRDDVVIAISNSGESDELLRIIPNIKMIGAVLIAITNNPNSHLALNSNVLCPIPKVTEACNIRLAPTSSTTVTLALGDAIGVVLSKLQSFEADDFAKYHPAGALGKKLTTTVEDVMHSGDENPVVIYGTTVKNALFEITRKRLGAVSVIDENGKMLGLVTDGDVRRCMDEGRDIHQTLVDEIMTKNPIHIKSGLLAIDALILLQSEEKAFSCLPVVDDNLNAIGMISPTDILKLGIIY